MEHFGLIVIGSGPGGYPAAIRAAQLGASVAIVEKEQLGGTCLNWGCIPSKMLISAAETYAALKHASGFGIMADSLTMNYSTLISQKNRTVAVLRSGIKQLLASNGVKQYTGTASFIDSTTVEVAASTGTTRLTARNIIIATGSTSIEPGFLPHHERVVESRQFLDRNELPGTLLILGGGVIGCELACMCATMGIKVTLVELLDDILISLDPDVRQELRTNMERNLNVRVLTGRGLEKIFADDQAAGGFVGEEKISADVLLCAIGRKPVTDGLRLEKAGLKTTQGGFIEVDEYSRTKVPSIFAVGDVTGKSQLAHYATAQGIAAAENAIGGQLHAHETLIPNVIFTSPEIGAVGLSESEAAKQNRAIKAGKFRFSWLGKAFAVGKTAGYVKWIADAKTDKVLGAAVVGASATELIAQAVTAIRAGFTARDIGNTVHAHPTFGEVWMEAAHQLHGQAIHAPQPKRKT